MDRRLRGVLWPPSLLILCLLTMGADGCSSAIKYQDDIEFDNSAQANSYEYPLKVGGVLCRDVDGRIGACLKQFPSDKPVKFHIDPQGYGYRMTMDCSSTIDSDLTGIDVEAGKAFDWEIATEKFSLVLEFTCTGEIFPEDRENSLSATWQLRALIFDAEYDAREVIYWRDDHLVLGKHAKHSRVCHDGECKIYHKETIVKAPEDSVAWSESELLRFNQYGL